jgi:hypothetical protein
MSRTRRFLGTLTVCVLIIAAACAAGLIFKGAPVLPDDSGDTDTASTIQGTPYPGDPEKEAALVVAEQERIDFVKSIGASVKWQVDRVDGPYRVPTTPASTLVLPARAEPYTRVDLRDFAPETFAAQPDGSFLLSENIVVLAGATLDMASSNPPVVNMLSTPEAYVSIVSLGGRLVLSGAPAYPAVFHSYDPAAATADGNTADGRAYVRAIGGTVDIQYAEFADLGFWSGETGGLALTGVNTADALPIAAEPSELGGAPTISGDELTEITASDQPEPGLLSGTVQHVLSRGNAFGLFVSAATNVAISGTRAEGSLIDGLVLHRFVTATTLDTVEATGNARDGIAVERSSSGVTMTAVTASRNGRNGIGIDGRPLVNGPSANGTPLNEYGDLHVVDSTVADNHRYGIQVTGGNTISITGTEITGHIVGITADHGATGVEISGNTLRGQDRQSIAVGGGVDDIRIHDNRFEAVDTGVRVRDASAVIEGNTFTDISNHAITLVGEATGTRATGNTVGGNGSTPFYDDAAGGYFADNDLASWQEPVTPTSVAQTLAQPLTLVWAGLGVLLLVTAIIGRRSRGTHDPYLERRPLTELTRGVVSIEELRGNKS